MVALLIILLVIWEIYWKSKALWLAAINNDKIYFIIILITGSIGILPIYYLYKKKYFK
tara:strand:+ start:806 stop:979 length:174 start_codon:yes stop_codon:yes gene_type:complete